MARYSGTSPICEPSHRNTPSENPLRTGINFSHKKNRSGCEGVTALSPCVACQVSAHRIEMSNVEPFQNKANLDHLQSNQDQTVDNRSTFEFSINAIEDGSLNRSA